MRTGLLPALVRRHLERSLSAGARVPGLVRIGQEGEMRLRPGGRAMRFSAVEELAVDRIAFSWRARFPLAIRVFDGCTGGRGKLEARVLGVPVMRRSGAEVAAGEVLRYLAELPWVPWAMEHNAELEWRELDERSVEVAGRAGGRRLAVTVEFDADGDIVRAGCDARPRQVGRTSVLTPWGGEFGDYRALGGMRIPTRARVYWELDEGRFVYWRGTVTSAVALEEPLGG
ncbi:MAG TPA: DUF6544 family protein [Solirubrobacteraceae bacterium]|nr:DUF6544 family protein [Solirubrobacteraceae bacterium]